jgi:hypothetical protein
MSMSLAPRRRLLAGTGLAALSLAVAATPAHAVIPNETKTPADIVDNADTFRGVGVIVTNQVGQGGVGICTATLINPRTVLFAAHCVNTRPETAYDGTTVRAAVSFNVNSLPGVQNWFANNRTNTALSVFNVNSIVWDSRSRQNAAALGFIEADVALASLDTPAAGIPTWAMLFSTLPAPTTVDPVGGLGYHVNIVGYGNTGSALTGPTGVDWRRRAAENMLSGFMSLSDRNTVIFGPAGASSLTQNVYHLDFDSQNRQAVFDINVHRDNALPNEGTTAPGDSGGPLVLTGGGRNPITNENLVIGVLSGGSRFFGPQPFGTLGTTSFYQPLSLFWEYVVANNPYRYVTARAGDGNWEDATRWQTTLDPNYRVIDSTGRIVNGLPTTPELGLNGTGGDWGSVCVEFEAPGDFCTDVATGVETDTSPTPPAQTVADVAVTETLSGEGAGALAVQDASAPGFATFDLAGAPDGGLGTAEDVAISANGLIPGGETVAINGSALIAQDAPQNVAATLPAPTLANGLVGATNFVPNNVNPVVSANPALRVAARYFDVTLANAGTTTLSSAVTIDKLTVRGSAGLTVAAAGSLRSLIDINQFGGRVNVNGGITSIGDYTLFSGMLEGTGSITAPFLTSIGGAISPGTMGTTGTLTVNGNLVMASGTNFLVDLGTGAASDRIAVNGLANVGGIVSIGTGVTQRVNGLGERYTILTSTGGVSGTFTARSISPILSQSFIYQPNAVLMQVNAASYNTVIDRNSTVQTAYAQLFDQNRPTAALAGLYALDFASIDTIRNTFSGLAPVNEQAVRSLAGQSINFLQNFNAARLREADKSRAGGKIAVTGRPLEMAQMSITPGMQPMGGDLMGMAQGEGETEVTEANLPDNVALYAAGGLVFGDVASLPGYTRGTTVAGQLITRDTEVDGFYLTSGLEFYTDDDTMIGISAYFSSLDASVPLGQRVESDTYAASLYMRHAIAGGPVIDGQFSMGSMGFDTVRQVQFLGTPQTLRSSSDDLLVSGALGISYDIASSAGTFSPGIEARYASVDLTTVRETGGTLGLAMQRESFESKQARFGFGYEKQGKSVAINANAQLVWEFEDGPQLLGANFAQGTGPNANFVLDNADHTWGEVGVNATFGTGALQMNLALDTTIGRDNADAQVIRAGATYRF